MFPMNHLRPLRTLSLSLFFLFFSVAAVLAQAQPPEQSQPAQGQNPPRTPDNQSPQPPTIARELPQDSIRPNYVLGPNDQVLVRARDVEEINEKPFRIDVEGNINLPLLGRLRAGG